MASKPMLTLLINRLEVCLIEGTRVRESGLTVSTETLPGETILFFHTDCDEGRRNLNMVGVGLKVCDYLVFYTKDDENKETVCFLELKGKRLEDATKQVISTYNRVKSLSREEIGRDQYPYITWKVCICMHGQAPRDTQRIADQLIEKFGKGNILIKHGTKHYQLLGVFLRKQTL